MSDSVWPQRRQPTRLPCPWDSPGKNPGVGCHFLLQCMKVDSEREVAQSCPTLSDPMDCSLLGSSFHGIFQARVLEWGVIAFSVWYLSKSIIWAFSNYSCMSSVCSVSSDSLWPHGLSSARLLCPWDSPDKNTGVGCHSLLQGIFPTQESNLGLLHCRQILYQLSYQGSPKKGQGERHTQW